MIWGYLTLATAAIYGFLAAHCLFGNDKSPEWTRNNAIKGIGWAILSVGALYAAMRLLKG
jgi:hypothetical protein